MARYIVLEYIDNEEAEEAVRQQNKATKNGDRTRVIGMFAPPKIFACKCDRVDGKYRRAKAERGDKFGWWLCGTCNKPRSGGHNLNNLIPLNEVLGKGPSGMTILDRDNGSHYEWKVSQLMIFEVPLDNIKRKKKRILKLKSRKAGVE